MSGADVKAGGGHLDARGLAPAATDLPWRVLLYRI